MIFKWVLFDDFHSMLLSSLEITIHIFHPMQKNGIQISNIQGSTYTVLKHKSFKFVKRAMFDVILFFSPD